MFVNFFYQLKEVGIPVSPTAFLTLQKALSKGLVQTIQDFYTTSRTILVKNERFFDLFDQVFAHRFQGADLPDPEGIQLDKFIRDMLENWLKNPKELADAMGISEDQLARLTPDELVDYFKKRLEDQKEEHNGGSKWIGTGGTSPVGHSGFHPGGMRVGGTSRNKSAIKVAMDRRYKEYSQSGPLTASQMGEALKRLRHMIPAGAKDQINIDESIYQTMKNAGEIQIEFDRSLKDRLNIILAIDNGGWSMEPHIPIVQHLFDYAHDQFREIKTCFFHNTIYETVWADSRRNTHPMKVDDFVKLDSETRFIFIGDASMSPYELIYNKAAIFIGDQSNKSSIDSLKFIAKTFPHAVWLNPVPESQWHYTQTIQVIKDIIPMFELSLDGLEKAVAHMMAS